MTSAMGLLVTSWRDRATGRAAVSGLTCALLLLVVGCGDQTSGPPRQSADRPITFSRCIAIGLDRDPPGFRLVERSLHRLGASHMGEVAIFGDGQQTITFYSGPDLYDQLEDIDLVAKRMQITGRTWDVYHTETTRSVRVAVLRDESLEEPCEDVGVVTKNVTRSGLLNLLSHVRLGRQRG